MTQHRAHRLGLSVFLVAAVAAGCETNATNEAGAADGNALGSGGSSGPIGDPQTAEAPESHVTVTVSPSSIYLSPGFQFQFTATVTGKKNQSVEWSVDRGTIDANGVLTAPATGGLATVTARSVVARSKKGTASANILSVPNTYTARTDRAVVQLPATIPNVGAATGQGTVVVDPDFGMRISRITDSSTAPRSLLTADGGGGAIWSVDSKHLALQSTGSRRFILSFDPTTLAATNTPLSYPYELSFSHTEPNVIYGLDGTRLVKITTNAAYTTSTEETLFDFVNGSTGAWGTTSQCLEAGFVPTWDGTFHMAKSDDTFVIGYSNTGNQGTGYYVAVYRTGLGCRVLNTRTGMITGNWGDIGSALDGSGAPLADRFTMHGVSATPNRRFATISYNVATACQKDPNSPQCKDKKGDPVGCLAGDCPNDSPYFWEIETRKLQLGQDIDGHHALGFKGMAVGKHYKLHDYDNPAVPGTILVQPPAAFPDMHGSWQNTNPDDSVPLFAATADVPSLSTYPCEWYDEIIGIAPDGSGKIYRFAHTFATGASPYFIAQNAIGVVSQDGHFVAFTSDWQNTLGLDAQGNPRADVFVVELK